MRSAISKPVVAQHKKVVGKTLIAIVEQCPTTGLYVGYMPTFPGADIQADTLDELYHNLHEVVDMILEDEGHPPTLRDFLGMQTVLIA